MDTANVMLEFANATNLGLLIVDGHGVIRHINPAAAGIFGYPSEELTGRPATTIVPERMRGAHSAGMNRVFDGQDAKHSGKPVEVMALRKNGTEVPVEITLSVWRSGTEAWAGAMVRDVSERRERDARLLRLAHQDSLTGLQNKRAFMAVAREAMASQPCAMYVLDLDGFREINDLYGLVVADTLIEAVGVRLSHFAGSAVSVARLGDDEFAILQCCAADTDSTVEMAQEVLKLFEKPFRASEMEFNLTTSIGVALSASCGDDADETLGSADFALQKVKKDGGRSCLIYDDAMRLESRSRRIVRNELRHGLKDGELKLFFQPQFDLSTNELLGFEALLRWQHPLRGLLGPASFLPALERSMLALDIGWWVLDEACRVAAAVNGAGRIYTVAVNLFPQQFKAADLYTRVMKALDKHCLSPAHLELELTEQTALDGHGKGIATLKSLRELGVGIAVDDFGTGYASLNSLQKVPLSCLKIDRSFVRDIQRSSMDRAIIRALVTMSRELGLKTVAEGIETDEQQAILSEIGCGIAQGFLYGQPADEAATIELAERYSQMSRRRICAA